MSRLRSLALDGRRPGAGERSRLLGLRRRSRRPARSDPEPALRLDRDRPAVAAAEAAYGPHLDRLAAAGLDRDRQRAAAYARARAALDGRAPLDAEAAEVLRVGLDLAAVAAGRVATEPAVLADMRRLAGELDAVASAAGPERKDHRRRLAG
jgi:hypothetical protein